MCFYRVNNYPFPNFRVFSSCLHYIVFPSDISSSRTPNRESRTSIGITDTAAPFSSPRHMEFLLPLLASRKWLLCILVSFFGFLFIIHYQGRYLPVSVLSFSSLRQPSYSPIPKVATWRSQKLDEQTQVKVQDMLHLPSPKPILQNEPMSPKPFLEEESLLPKSKLSPSELEISPLRTAIVVDDEEIVKPTIKDCDIFDGKWVYDPKAYPLYKGKKCHFMSDQVNCRKNGRRDSNYEHWRWQPKDCDIPRFNGTDMLERLRGKRVVIVGDSLNQVQWESFACLLYSAVPRSRTYIKLRSDYKIFRAEDYNCTVEFFWSPFLVPMEKTSNGSDPITVLKLEKLPESSERWRGADVMVFNSGHWWTHRGRFKKWNYYELDGKLVEEMEGDMEYGVGLKTWADWIDQTVDATKTKVFFRSISPEHYSHNWCYNKTHPMTNETYAQRFPSSMVSIAERMMKEMRTPVVYLNITRLSEYRWDAHTSIYIKVLSVDELSKPEAYADCSHWCLPGLPDTWNVLIFASIFGTPSTYL